MKRSSGSFWTLLFAVAAVGFALTAHRDAWMAWRWAFLVLAGVGICGGWVADDDPIGTIFGRPRGKHLGWWIVSAAALAVLAAVAYRRLRGQESFPASLHWFAVVAMAIGATEELLWRGWMQGTLAKSLVCRGGADIPVCQENGGIFGRQECLPHCGSVAAVLAAAGAHAAYKTTLFVFPPDGIARQSSGALLFLAGATFGFGAILGLIRLRQGTIAAPVAFHVLFDLLVYGQYATAPWWVW